MIFLFIYSIVGSFIAFYFGHLIGALLERSKIQDFIFSYQKKLPSNEQSIISKLNKAIDKL